MRGNLKIVKTSSDGKVKGFAFRITGANGYDIILETNDKGEIVIDGIRIGDYTIGQKKKRLLLAAQFKEKATSDKEADFYGNKENRSRTGLAAENEGAGKAL
ncbi:cna protein B-type domain [Firmicutes bacterium CAG:83]|nr:cna protein B-type domain [Firmicutes bacterium CAG:83]